MVRLSSSNVDKYSLHPISPCFSRHLQQQQYANMETLSPQNEKHQLMAESTYSQDQEIHELLMLVEQKDADLRSAAELGELRETLLFVHGRRRGCFICAPQTHDAVLVAVQVMQKNLCLRHTSTRVWSFPRSPPPSCFPAVYCAVVSSCRAGHRCS